MGGWKEPEDTEDRQTDRQYAITPLNPKVHCKSERGEQPASTPPSTARLLLSPTRWLFRSIAPFPPLHYFVTRKGEYSESRAACTASQSRLASMRSREEEIKRRLATQVGRIAKGTLFMPFPIEPPAKCLPFSLFGFLARARAQISPLFVLK